MKTSKSKKLVLLFVAFLGLVSIYAKEIVVGGKTIIIPVQDGFVDGATLKPTVATQLTTFSPPGTKLYSIYIESEIAEGIALNHDIQGYRFLLVSALKELESASISFVEFTKMKAMLRNQFDSLTPEMKKRVEEFKGHLSNVDSSYNPDFDFSLSNVIPLGINYESDKICACSTIMNFTLYENSIEVSKKIACSTVTILVYDKVLCLYAYSIYKDQSDVLWVQEQSVKLAKSILDANTEDPECYEKKEESEASNDRMIQAIGEGVLKGVSFFILFLIFKSVGKFLNSRKNKEQKDEKD